jgi:CBS domain-containing protein
MAATDPTAYVRATAPFGGLPAPLFEAAARALDVAFHPAGTWLARAGGRPFEHLHVIRKGVVRLERDGQTIQVLEEGEVFGYTSLLAGKATIDVLVEEDLVAYRIPAAVFRRLLSDAAFAGHFAAGLSERLKASLAQSPVATFPPDLTLDVRQVLREHAVWVDAGATVGEVARRMRDARVTSVLVRGDPIAIATDRDLRNRVLAEGLGPEAPVASIATPSPRTVATGTPIHEAWAELLRAGVHHLPVVERGEIVGVLTATDLLRCSAQGPMAVLRRVERLASRERLAGYGQTVAEMASALLAGGLDATIIAGFVARLNDTLLARIVRMAESETGPAPVPWAWLALGSEGRKEQTLLTDQDNALAWADEGDAERAWFERFVERIAADLRTAGFPECPGGYMAARWMGPLGEWTRRFASWIDAPSPASLLQAAIFLDFRRVAGALDVAPLEAALTAAPSRPVFLRFLARAALEFRPPPALVLRLKGDASTVDLKAHGIAPVVLLARCYGLELGGRARSTLERIEAAAAAGNLSAEVHANVADAYRFLVGQRLRLQLRALAAGRPAGHAVALADLPAVERSRLKDALRAVRGFQEAGAHHFRTDF